jgi:hypothetical protein
MKNELKKKRKLAAARCIMIALYFHGGNYFMGELNEY